MAREIAFRGRRTSGRGWVVAHQSYMHPSAGYSFVQPSVFWKYVEGGKVDRETVGEWTGRQDAKGTPIFEGDRVKTADGGVYIVVWIDHWAGFYRQVVNPSDYEPNDVLQPLPSVVPLEVIGNIHEEG